MSNVTLDSLLLDIFGNVIGNKLTDTDKERMLRAIFSLLLEVCGRLERIENKIERLEK